MYKGPLRFAHRGLTQQAPENTLEAFEAAVSYGCEGIEIDVQLTKDHQAVIFHDYNLTRMTLGCAERSSNGRICEMTWEELSCVQIPFANHLLPEHPPAGAENEFLAGMPERIMGQEKGRDYASQLKEDPRTARILRFEDFDRWLAGKSEDILVEIEIKASGAAQVLARLMESSRNLERYIVFSGNDAYIREIQRDITPALKARGLRCGANIRRLTEQARQQVLEMDLFEIGLDAGAFTAQDVAWLKEQGVEVLSNLGDYPRWWETLQQTGALGFKSNYVGAYSEWYAGR